MLFKVVHTRKVFATRFTTVWLLSGMYPPMFHQVVLLQERLSTLVARELFRAIVILFVPGQNVTVGEGCITDVTCVRSLPRMSPDVVAELTWFTELLLTLLTGEILLVAVNSFDVFI